MMKRALFPLAAMIGMTALPAHAVCTGDLPQTGFANIYQEATGDAVIGGIAPNQCGIELTDFCDAGRCLMFFDGLSGFIDVTGLVAPFEDPIPVQFAYTVDSVDGSLSFMGQSQDFALTENRPIFVEPRADHVLLRLPPPLPTGIRMTSTGSSGWEAELPDWVGVPVPVGIYLDRVSADMATLEFFADHEILKMDVQIRLARIAGAQTEEGAPPAPAETDQTACDRTLALALEVAETQDQALIDAYFGAVAAVGITDWDNRSENQCAALLTALADVGIGAVPRSADGLVDCSDLIATARPILRGADSAARRALLATMVTLGVSSFDATNPKHCSEVANVLGQ